MCIAVPDMDAMAENDTLDKSRHCKQFLIGILEYSIEDKQNI
jgi:hypothetical protein